MVAHYSAQDVLSSTALLRELPPSMAVTALRSGETLDRDGLAARVAARHTDLMTQMVPSASRVVIGLTDPLETLIALFAAWASGHCAVLVNPGLSADERDRVSAKVGAALWIDDRGEHRIGWVSGGAGKATDAALILMTSGTTGDPKGVTHSLQTLKTRLALNLAEIGAEPLARTLCPLPLFFGHGLIGNCLTALFAGQHVFLLDAPGLQDFAGFGALIEQHDITFLSSVPSMWRMVLRLSPAPSRAPVRVHVGSAPLTEELWSEIEAWCGTDRVFNTYGMTETANWISGTTRPTAAPDGCVGRPWGGAFRVVIDGEMRTEGRGEVAILSPTLMLGLWEGEGYAPQGEGAFLTGDIGELDADQGLRLVGRSKNEINRAGIKVLAEEVDMLLERHPEVAEACAFGIPDPVAGEAVGAVVRLREGGAASEDDIRGWCRAHARKDAVPQRLAIVEVIEKTDRGKLARTDIQKRMIERWC